MFIFEGRRSAVGRTGPAFVSHTCIIFNKLVDVYTIYMSVLFAFILKMKYNIWFV